MGHSEGGTVAPRVANQSEHVSFLVLVAGTALTGGEIIRHQNEVILESQGLTGEELSEQLDFVDVVREAVETDTGWEEVEREMRRLLYESIERMSLRERALITDDDAWVDAVAQAQLATLRSPWYRSFYVYDPAVALAELAVPVLAVFAEHDLQIPGQPNEAAMRKALTEAGNPDFTIVTVGDTDHSFPGGLLRHASGAVRPAGIRVRSGFPGHDHGLDQWPGAGSLRIISVNSPGSDWAVIEPPCWRTTSLQRLRPNPTPVPEGFVV